jgi:hypothetical protein
LGGRTFEAAYVGKWGASAAQIRVICGDSLSFMRCA